MSVNARIGVGGTPPPENSIFFNLLSKISENMSRTSQEKCSRSAHDISDT